MPTVVLATGNKGKVAELSAMLEGFDVTVKYLADYPEIGDIPETGDTFAENAMIKARAVCEATGLVAIADDSGLEVDALDGAPGVYSARYSADMEGGPSTPLNNAKLMDALRDVPEEKRGARFRCVMIAYAPNGASITADGSWDGRIAPEPDGDNGFGYDPVFYVPELGTTAANLDRADKNARSHRGKALRALLDQWPGFWERANADSSARSDRSGAQGE